jgi:hypothetical protein
MGCSRQGRLSRSNPWGVARFLIPSRSIRLCVQPAVPCAPALVILFRTRADILDSLRNRGQPGSVDRRRAHRRGQAKHASAKPLDEVSALQPARQAFRTTLARWADCSVSANHAGDTFFTHSMQAVYAPTRHTELLLRQMLIVVILIQQPRAVGTVTTTTTSLVHYICCYVQ